MKGIERAKEFLEMYKKGATYKEIGIKYNISNVRVGVELHKYFPEEIKNITKNRGWYVGKRKPAKEYEIYECKWCGKKQQSKYRYYTPKFCSKECRGEFIKKAFK